MAPWWLRSKKDEPYEDPLEIDDAALASIAIEPEPDDEAAAPSGPPDAAAATQSGQQPAKRKRRRRKRKRKRKPEAAAPDDAAPERAPEPREDDGAAAAEPAPAPAAREAPEHKASDHAEIVFDFTPPERSVAVGLERKIALFCDLENIALGVRNSETKKFDIGLVLERLLEKGKIIVKKAYADWERYSDYKRAFHDAAIELIDIPQKHYSGKNSADIKMVVDAMDLCFSKEHLDTFVIMSGDSDFSPLVSKLKENNKYVIGIGVKNSTSSHLIDNCDEFIYYEDVWRDLQRTPRLDHLSPGEAEVFGLLIDSILALIRENKSVLWGSMIKQTMQRKRPSFSEGSYDYSSFGALLEDAAEKNIIRLKRDERSGNLVVIGFGQQS